MQHLFNGILDHFIQILFLYHPVMKNELQGLSKDPKGRAQKYPNTYYSFYFVVFLRKLMVNYLPSIK